jgi:D-amino peptidase
MRKLFISADMEGCPAVSTPQALMPDRWMWEWTAARRWMTQEVVATSEAAFDAGFDEVIVTDSHGNAHNIEPDSLPDNVWLVRSWPRPLFHMQGIDDTAIVACAFTGLHAGPACRDSSLAHIYHGGAFRSISLNGCVCSEGYLNAALAGEFGVPVVLVSGDEQTIEDARRYSPDGVGFVSKHSIGVRSQMSLPPPQVCRNLKQAMAGALSRPLPKPFVIEGPYHLEFEMTTQAAAEMLGYLPCVERLDAYRVSTIHDRLEAAMRFISFATLYSPTGVPAL